MHVYTIQNKLVTDGVYCFYSADEFAQLIDIQLTEHCAAIMQEEIQLFIATVLNKSISDLAVHEIEQAALVQESDTFLVFSWEDILILRLNIPIASPTSEQFKVECIRYYEGDTLTIH